MHDQPEPTEQEEEQVPERLEEHEAMQYPGHEDPTPQRPDDPAAAEPQDDEEIHDA